MSLFILYLTYVHPTHINKITHVHLFEGSNLYQNSAGVDLPKSALETEDHVPKAEHIDLINIAHHQGRSTHERAPLLKGTNFYSCFQGDVTNNSRASPPVAD